MSKMNARGGIWISENDNQNKRCNLARKVSALKVVEVHDNSVAFLVVIQSHWSGCMCTATFPFLSTSAVPGRPPAPDPSSAGAGPHHERSNH
jgi:hypothetical protein